MRGSHYWSAFQQDSYAARVEFEDGFVTVVACPSGCASKHKPGSPWLSAYVRQEADAAWRKHKIAFPDASA